MCYPRDLPSSSIRMLLLTDCYEVPFHKKIFAGFKSQCMMFIWCRQWSPIASYKNILQISCSPKKVPFFRKSCILWRRSPSLANSITMHRVFEGSSRNAARYPIIFLCLIDAKKRTSLSAFSLSFSFNLAILTCLRAYSRLSCLRMAKLT